MIKMKYKIKRNGKFECVDACEMTIDEIKRVIRRMKISYYDRIVGATNECATLWMKYGKCRIYIPYGKASDGIRKGYIELRDGEWIEHPDYDPVEPEYDRHLWEQTMKEMYDKYQPILDEIKSRFK